jgi:hypothetical protein
VTIGLSDRQGFDHQGQEQPLGSGGEADSEQVFTRSATAF